MADLLGTELELPTLLEYAKRYFVWGECPHIRRVLEENGHCTERHARIQRGRLENHVLNDPFVEKRLSDIKRADAVGIFEDIYALTLREETHQSESRFVTTGSDFLGRVVTVVYTIRDEDYRIISARESSKRERKEYRCARIALQSLQKA